MPTFDGSFANRGVAFQIITRVRSSGEETWVRLGSVHAFQDDNKWNDHAHLCCEMMTGVSVIPLARCLSSLMTRAVHHAEFLVRVQVLEKRLEVGGMCQRLLRLT